jgi:hypothetical protein
MPLHPAPPKSSGPPLRASDRTWSQAPRASQALQMLIRRASASISKDRHIPAMLPSLVGLATGRIDHPCKPPWHWRPAPCSRRGCRLDRASADADASLRGEPPGCRAQQKSLGRRRAASWYWAGPSVSTDAWLLPQLMVQRSRDGAGPCRRFLTRCGHSSGRPSLCEGESDFTSLDAGAIDA